VFTDRNRVLVFTARGLRTFGFGLLSIVLPLYLKELGLPATLIGLVFSLTLVEDALATTAITVFADRFGRRLVLTLAPLLVVLAGVGFATAQVPWLIILVAVVGTISPGGVEAGPFLAVEQAVLSERASGHKRTGLLAWYNVVGSLFAALGAGAAGLIPHLLRQHGWTQIEAFRAVFWIYAAIGIALMFVAAGMNRDIEAARPTVVRGKVVMGLHRSKGIVAKLCLLFGVDALAGGFIVQQLLVYWFSVRFNVGAGVLGPVFLGTNLLSAVSFLAAAPLAKRIGLLNTMVFTHLPSNILLCFVPLMPTFHLAVAMLMLRHLLSQMDVPTRQAYTMALVAPDERSAAAGITASVRSIAQAVSPAMSGAVMALAVFGWHFIIAGTLKSAYDVAIWLVFRKVEINDG